jgi:uncharacterized protein (TIGR02118 family)
MYKLTVLYHHPNNVEEFESYYEKVHLPLAQNMPGLSKLELTRFTSGPGGTKADFHRMAELYFINEAQMIETMGSPEGQAAINDLHNFATGGVNVMIGVVPSEVQP